MFSLYVSGREISLTQKEFAIFLNLVARRGEFVAAEWLGDAVYGILHEGDTALLLAKDMEKLRESLSNALGHNAIVEDQRGYALSEAVAFKVRAL
jgi:DNA-binding response OmpR family regulator